MAIQETIYNKALEFGANNIKEGVTYNELLNYLKENKLDVNDGVARSFHVWFYETFYVSGIYERRNDPSGMGVFNEDVLRGKDNTKGFLTGEAYLKYLDFLEYRQALKSAKQSSNLAKIAIAISAILALIQIVLQFVCGCK